MILRLSEYERIEGGTTKFGGVGGHPRTLRVKLHEWEQRFDIARVPPCNKRLWSLAKGRK